MVFALDDLMNRACRTSFQVRQIRQSTGYTINHEAIIQFKVAQLEEDILTWRKLPRIRTAERLEQAAQQTASSEPSQQTFLDYPPLVAFNPFYVHLLGTSRAISLYISLIANPITGFSTIPERFHIAVELCRTIAALENDKTISLSSRIWMIYIAAVAFGGRKHAPREVEWLLEKVDYIAKFLPLKWSAFGAYVMVWDFGGDFSDALERLRPFMEG
jgi:hypothetical protein